MSTHIKISTITVGSGGAASIDFTSIPATYTDLKLVVSGRNSTASTQLLISFNGSGSSYSGKRLYGSGSAASSDSSSTGNFNPSGVPMSTYTASVFGNAEIYIPNYTSANYKSVSIDAVSENNATEAYGGIFAGLWSNTAVINQITLVANGGNMTEFSSATLYGIKSS